jgi:hypothetical protein
MIICSSLMVLAAVGSAILVDNNVLRSPSGEELPEPECLTSCAVGAPPLEPRPVEPRPRMRAAPGADSH